MNSKNPTNSTMGTDEKEKDKKKQTDQKLSNQPSKISAQKLSISSVSKDAPVNSNSTATAKEENPKQSTPQPENKKSDDEEENILSNSGAFANIIDANKNGQEKQPESAPTNSTNT